MQTFDVKITPKAHFLSHYPDLMFYYGGLLSFSTLKFERKHSTVKKLIKQSKNFQNVTYSLAESHQLLQAATKDALGKFPKLLF